MPERKPSLIISDILTCISHIQQYTNNLGFDDFTKNFMVTEACLYNIQVIGEAVSHLPDDIKEKEIHIPWKLIKGMRNRFIHEYFGTDLPLVWSVIKDELPSFESDLRTILLSLQEQGR
jgi:uncharacterized protein with HEPN domain